MQGDEGLAWWASEGLWPTAGLLRRPGLGADVHLARAAGLLERAQPAQWRASSARAYGERLAELVADLQRLRGDVAMAEVQVAAFDAELVAARAALRTSPWWAAG